MSDLLTDREVADLIREKKILPSDWRARIRFRDARKGRHKEWEKEVDGEEGSRFKIIARDNPSQLSNFSVMLVYFDDKTTKRWRLRRYNSKADFHHTNRLEYREGLEGHRFKGECHIHYCTERYQTNGFNEDHYAEITTKYTSLEQALDCLIEECNFEVLPGSNGDQTTLFK